MGSSSQGLLTVAEYTLISLSAESDHCHTSRRQHWRLCCLNSLFTVVKFATLVASMSTAKGASADSQVFINKEVVIVNLRKLVRANTGDQR